MKQLKQLLVFLIIFLGSFSLRAADTDTTRVYVIPIDTEIGATSWLYLKEGMKEAQKLQAHHIIIHLNTYGGTVLHADSMRTAILKSKTPVYAFIDNNAASAGALISIACDSIYMRSGANIGAATVVDEQGSAMPDKYQSYMRATMRATAQAKGKIKTCSATGDTLTSWRRDPLIAEAMVDDRIVIPHVIDSGKVLTLTADEAINLGYCEGKAESVQEIIETQLHDTNYKITTYKPTWVVKTKGFFSSPALQAVLIMLIVGGIFFELQTPGLGFPSAVALIAAALYFLPLYITGVAENWEILLFVIGILLLIAEIFIIPGFGVAGVSGIVLIIASLILAAVANNNFNFDTVTSLEINRSVLTLLSGILLGTVLAVYLSHKIGKRGILHQFALQSDQQTSDGFVGVDMELAKEVGATGIAHTSLRPAGKIEVNGHYFDAVSLRGYIEKGSAVKVVKFENAQLYVTPFF